MTAERFRPGWVRDKHDERDRSYCVRHRGPFPEQVDLRARFATGIVPFDQGPIGSCGPWSAKSNLIYDDLVDQTWTNPSALFIYYCTREIMGTVLEDSGVSNRDLMKALAQRGWCDESLWPYEVSRYTVRPSQAAYDQAATRKIPGYARVEQSEGGIKGCLSSGDTFILGFMIYPSYVLADDSGIFPDPRPGERDIGGHDVVAVGYDAQGVTILNSWGMWGLGGYGKLSWRYVLNRQHAGDFWAVQGANVTPGPVPPPEPPLPPPPVPPPSPPIDWQGVLCGAWNSGLRSGAEWLVGRLPSGPWRDSAQQVIDAANRSCPLL